MQDWEMIGTLGAEGCGKDEKAKDCASNWYKRKKEFEMGEAGRAGRNKRWVGLRVTSLSVTFHATHLPNTLGTQFFILLAYF